VDIFFDFFYTVSQDIDSFCTGHTTCGQVLVTDCYSCG
jgi:hypothetical protein